MSNPEGQAFNKDRLRWLEFEMEQDLQMIQEGSTPDEVARAHSFVNRIRESNQRFDELVGNEILARYGVDDSDQLPTAGIIKYAEAHAKWIEEHPIHE